MSRTANVNNVEVVLLNQSVEVNIDEVQSWGCTPVTEQSGLHVFKFQRFPQQRICIQIDLSDREVIGGAPIGIHFTQLFWRKRLVRNRRSNDIGRCGESSHKLTFSF